MATKETEVSCGLHIMVRLATGYLPNTLDMHHRTCLIVVIVIMGLAILASELSCFLSTSELSCFLSTFWLQNESADVPCI